MVKVVELSFEEPLTLLKVARDYEPYLKMTNQKLLKNMFGDVKENYTEEMVEIEKITKMLRDYDAITNEINQKMKKDRDNGFYRIQIETVKSTILNKVSQDKDFIL